MRSYFSLGAVLPLVALVLPVPTGAAYDVFLKIEGIPGESADPLHPGWIGGLAVSGGHSRFPDSFSQPFFADIVIRKELDKASPKLAESCALGTSHPVAEVALILPNPAGGEPLVRYRLVLRDAMVSSHQVSGSALDDGSRETLSLGYSRIDWQYHRRDGDGNTLSAASAYWDLVTNTGDAIDGVNTPPVIQQAAQQSVAPGETRTVQLLVDDLETQPDNLQLSATTNRPDLVGNLVLGGSGGARTLTFRASTLFSGSAGLTVTVSDGFDSRSMSFAVLIDVAMTPYEAFLSGYFSPEELSLDPYLADPLGDPDLDGLVTLMEFHLGTNPREATPQDHALRVEAVPTETGFELHVAFERRIDDRHVRGSLWGSTDLQTWTKLVPGGPLYEETGTGGTNPLFQSVSGRVTPPNPGSEPFLLRYQVELEP